MEANNYYLEKLNNHKRTGYIFGRFPIPKGIPFVFTFSTIFISALIESVIPTFFIIPIISIIVCWDHYTRIYLRSTILEDCIVEESMFRTNLIRYGVDPNFPEDPLDVTEEDRKSIFEDLMYINQEKSTIQKIKNHYRFLISIVAMFMLLYYGIKFLC